MQVARFNYSEPPPGYEVKPWSNTDAFALVVGGKTDFPYRTREQAICVAWTHHRASNNPPGMWISSVNGRGGAHAWGLSSYITSNEVELGVEDDEAAARRAAWKWYDDRLEFEPEEGCLLEDHDGAPVPAAPVWPRCLAWPDRTVVEVKAWTADPHAPLPEVLRWYQMTDGTAERWEPVDVG